MLEYCGLIIKASVNKQISIEPWQNQGIGCVSAIVDLIDIGLVEL